MSKEILMLWILNECQKIENKIPTASVEEAFMYKGQLDILQTLFSDFNLEMTKNQELTYHSDI